MMTVAALRREAEAALLKAGVADATLDAAYLVTAALNIEHTALLLQPDAPVTAQQAAHVYDFIARRIAREPLDRIMGSREFYSLSFGLNEATLSPRADTETLVDAVLALKPQRILDVGTGSGCVALALLANAPTATAVATDISTRALQQAAANAATLGLAARIEFVQTNYVEGITGLFDVIVSNPPYIPSRDIPALADEVKNHDPHLALDGGADGLDAYRHLLTVTPILLAPDGWLLFEVGYNQAHDVQQLAVAAGWQLGPTYHDLGGITRVLAFFR